MDTTNLRQVLQGKDAEATLNTVALLLCDILDELRKMNAATDRVDQRWTGNIARDGIGGTDGGSP